MSCVQFLGHRQAVQTQISFRRTRRLIRVYTLLIGMSVNNEINMKNKYPGSRTYVFFYTIIGSFYVEKEVLPECSAVCSDSP